LDNESPAPPPLPLSTHNPRKDAPRRENEEERKMWKKEKEEKETNEVNFLTTSILIQ
jgi:hypothetical protein